MEEKQKVEANTLAKPNTIVTMKENLYDKINVSVQAMNVVIAVLVTAIVVFLAFGIWQAYIK